MLKFTDNNGISITFTDNPTYLNNGAINVPYNGLYIVKSGEGYTFNKISDGDVLFTCKEFYIDDNIGTIESYASTFYKKGDSETIKQLQGIISDFITAYDENFGDTIYPSYDLPENAVAGTYYNNEALYKAIVAKGVTPATKHIEDYATAVKNIPSNSLNGNSMFTGTIKDISKWNVVDDAFWNKPIFYKVNTWEQGDLYDVAPSSNINLSQTFSDCYLTNDVPQLFGDNFLSKVVSMDAIIQNSNVSCLNALAGEFTNLQTIQYRMVSPYYIDEVDSEVVFNCRKTVKSAAQFFEIDRIYDWSASVTLKFSQEFLLDSPKSNYIIFGSAIKYIYGSAGFKGITNLYLGCSSNYPVSSDTVKKLGQFIGYKNLDDTWYDFSDAPILKYIYIGGKNISQEWLAALSNGIRTYAGTIVVDSDVLSAMDSTVKANFTNKKWTLTGQ